ncbi:Rap/ran-GAP protein [Mortierella sp. GBA30]|nr:Rap/ran-GAP protein [Mortierella sp. GBA30]
MNFPVNMTLQLDVSKSVGEKKMDVMEPGERAEAVYTQAQESMIDSVTTEWSQFPSDADDRVGTKRSINKTVNTGTANDSFGPEQEPNVAEIDLNMDSAKAVEILFEDMDLIMARMVEIMSKHASMSQLSALHRGLHGMRVQAKGALRAKMKHIQKRAISHDNIPEQHLGEHSEATEFDPEVNTESIAEEVHNHCLGRIKCRDSNNDTRHRQDLNQHTESHGQDQRRNSKDSYETIEIAHMEHLDTIKNYIQTILQMGESCLSEYLQTYNRMLVVPTTGYRIEGCNDFNKIVGALRTEPHNAPLPTQGISLGMPRIPLQMGVPAALRIKDDATNQRPITSIEDIYPNNIIPNAEAPMAVTNSGGNPESHGGLPMTRIKSMPESKDEWASLQRRKLMSGSRSEAISSSLVSPAATGITMGGGIGGIGATGAGAFGSVMGGPDMSMLGEYSKEHMGHEAYYYRNWFLGREHRTFVGQVEGLGTVIISIIKDMVVPEPRIVLPSRINGVTIASSVSNAYPETTNSSSVSGATISSNLLKADPTHSSQSLPAGRGAGGGRLLSGSRMSSEAMRVILSASTVVAAGAGSSSTSSSSNNHYSTPSRWQYRCILRQKDVDSLRITLPEPEPSPLNNLARRVGKPQWKSILQSIHPAITQQAASKLKKVQNNQHFEMELAKFDETMLRFNYKFGVLLVHPGQTREEDWFSNQMTSSPNFQEFLESGALGQKVVLKGFQRFSAGLDTRLGEAGKYSYYDTWGEGFEIMYHVSTLLPYNTIDRQQIQRKRHIGNDIVCIIFVDGDQPFIPNAIKSQFLHIFLVIRQIVLPDGTKGYSAAVVCDDQVPDFGPPLPDPPIFKTSQELRAFLLCKMINGENAAYKAPRLIKPHQRARSGMLENLVAKANTLAKDKDSDKRLSKQQKALASASLSATLGAATTASHVSVAMATNSTPTTPAIYPSGSTAHCCHCHQRHQDGDSVCDRLTKVEQLGLLHGSQDAHPFGGMGHSFPISAPTMHSVMTNDEARNRMRAIKANTFSGTRTISRSSLVLLASETKGSLFKPRRRSSNADATKREAFFQANVLASKEIEKEHGLSPGTDPQSGHRDSALPFSRSPKVIPAPLIATAVHLDNLDSTRPSYLNPSFQSHCLCCCCYLHSYYSCLNLDQIQGQATDLLPSVSAFEPLSRPGSAERTSPMTSSLLYPGSAGRVPLQRAQSLASTPTESHFTVNRRCAHHDRSGSSVLPSSRNAASEKDNKDYGIALGINSSKLYYCYALCRLI